MQQKPIIKSRQNICKPLTIVTKLKKSTKKSSQNNILIAFLLNFVFVLIEAIGGFFTNSVAILSDAIHDFGDCVAIGTAFFLEKKSNKKANLKYSYGYKRYSIISALLSSSILLVGGAVVIYTSILRIITPKPINGLGMLIIASVGVVINGFAVLRTAKSHNINEKAISLHLLEDVLGWVIVLIGSLFVFLFNITIIDPILSIVVTIFIIFNVVKHIIEIIGILTEKTPKNFDTIKFKAEVLQVENVYDVHHIHVWSLNGETALATLHVTVTQQTQLSDFHKIKQSITQISKKFKIDHITIQLDTIDEHCHDHCSAVKKKDDVHCHAHHHH